MIHQDLDSPVLKKVKHQRVLNKEVTKLRTQNPLVITIIRRGILLMFVGVERSINRTHLKAKGIVTSATSKDVKHKIARLKSQGHKDFMVTTTIARSMDIEPLSANQSLCGH